MWGTAVLVLATALALAYSWVKYRKIPMMALVGGVAVALFGGLTLYFNDEFFIKIKPTVISLLFALVLVVLVAFTADASTSVLRKTAGGALWLGLLMASARSLDLSWAVETDNDALTGMVLWPVHPAAMFYGKALANTAVLFLVGIALTPLVIAMYNAPIVGPWSQFLAVLVLGGAALAAPGTFYALLTTRARASSVLLPLLMFPLVVPALLAASRATSLLMEGDAMGEVQSWFLRACGD